MMTFDEVTALDTRWTYTSATANVKQGISVHVDGKRQWYEEHKPGQYRLVYERQLNPFDGVTAKAVSR